MREIIRGVIYKGEEYYVAECLDFPVVTQAKDLDEAVRNLKEAIDLHLEDEDMNRLGFVESPRIEIMIEAGELTHVS